MQLAPFWILLTEKLSFTFLFGYKEIWKMKEQPFKFNSLARQFRSMYWRHARFTKTIKRRGTRAKVSIWGAVACASLIGTICHPSLSTLWKGKGTSSLLLMPEATEELLVCRWFQGLAGRSLEPFSFRFFSPYWVLPESGTFSTLWDEVCTGHHFPLRQMPSLLADLQNSWAQPRTFDPSAQLTAQLAARSFHLS